MAGPVIRLWGDGTVTFQAVRITNKRRWWQLWNTQEWVWFQLPKPSDGVAYQTEELWPSNTEFRKHITAIRATIQ